MVQRVVAEWAFSERRACRLIGVSRSVVRYVCQSSDPPGLRERLCALAAERRFYTTSRDLTHA